MPFGWFSKSACEIITRRTEVHIVDSEGAELRGAVSSFQAKLVSMLFNNSHAGTLQGYVGIKERWLRKIGQRLKWVPALITSPVRMRDMFVELSALPCVVLPVFVSCWPHLKTQCLFKNSYSFEFQLSQGKYSTNPCGDNN
jgi:hypothetical protein